jgi:hypothetical protein
VKLSIPRFGFGSFAIRFENAPDARSKKGTAKGERVQARPVFLLSKRQHVFCVFLSRTTSHALVSRAVDVFEEPYGVPQRLD